MSERVGNMDGFNILGNFATKRKSEVDHEKVQGEGWHDERSLVTHQGIHASCWTEASSGNITDARFHRGIDETRTRYSSTFLLDVVDHDKAYEKLGKSDGEHSCYGYSTFKAMEYIMNNGIPKHSDWTFPRKCNNYIPRLPSHANRVHVLNDVRCFTDVHRAIHYLKDQPIIGAIALFSPEFPDIGGNIYRGPTSRDSTLYAWHAVSVEKIYILNGEVIADCKNSHGTEHGVGGYFKASLDVLIAELDPKTGIFGDPFRLFRYFIYGEVRKEFEKRVEEYYACGHGPVMDSCTKSNFPEEALSLLLDASFHNTSCDVCEHEDKQEVTGTPTDRALFKWAIKLEKDAKSTYSRSNSKIVKGPCHKESLSKRKDPSLAHEPVIRAHGVALDTPHGIRIHWKGKAAFILDRCTRHYSNGKAEDMSEAEKNKIRGDIKRMEANGLICTALAFKETERSALLEFRKSFLSSENLIFLALFGIQDPCILPEDSVEVQAALDFEDGVGDLDHLSGFLDSHFCPSTSGIMDQEIWNEAAPQGSDLDFTVDLPKEVRSRGGDRYDICLYARIGLHCHNLQEGTNFKFNHWEKYGTMMSAYLGFYITLEATDPATGSVFCFQTLLSDVGRSNPLGVMKVTNVNKLTSAGCKVKIWIADWFAQLNNKLGGDLEKIKVVGEYFKEIWEAGGMNPEKVEFLWASDEISTRGNTYWPLVMDIARRNNLRRILRCGQIMERSETEVLSAAQILYPCMQCADIFFLEADICQLGMDQRKVNMLAREYCDDIKRKNKPIILSHHMLPGLRQGQEKMSKSDPSSAIFMEDEEYAVNKKISKAHCPERTVAGNPCFEYVKYLVLPRFNEFVVENEKNGGNKTFTSFEDIAADYESGELSREDLKKALIKALNIMLQPVRHHFKTNERAKNLLKQVKLFGVTR